MNRFSRLVAFFILPVLSVGLLPGAALAEEVKTETVTVQVNTTTPAGVSIIGTLVIHRQGDASVASELSFNGMVNGTPASAAATATENWSSDGQAQIQINEITAWQSTLPRPATLAINVSQTGAGVVSFNGIPVAIDGPLARPFSGRTSYTATNAGQGTSQIVVLPRTGDGSLFLDPLLIAGLLIVPGLLLVLLSSLVRKLGPRPAAVVKR